MANSYFIVATDKILLPEAADMLEFHGVVLAERIAKAIKDECTFVFVPKEQEDANLAAGDLGVVGFVDQAFSLFREEIKLAVTCGERVRVESLEDYGRASMGTAEPLPYVWDDMPDLPAFIKEARYQYAEFCELTEKGKANADIETDEAFLRVARDVIATLPDDEAKYAYFSAYSIREQLIAMIRIFSAAAEEAKIDSDVREKVKEAIDDNQREYYIREQIKALSAEIDEDDETEAYLEKIEALKADDEVKAKLRRDANRLRKMAPASPEMAILKNYLDVCLELPWGIYTEDNDDLAEAKRVLDEDHYGLQKVKERLLEALAVRKLSQEGRSPILCLVGPPGIGKTSIAQSIARAMHKKYVRLSFGGVRDEAEIRGHRKTYIGSMPGRIINGIKTAGSSNPVFLMDEIDKMASDYKGDPASALLEVLDPEQNAHFRDHFIELPFDLSKVLFITTANSLDTISRPLLDRMEVIEMTGYTQEEKVQIAKRYLIPKMAKQCGISEDGVHISDEALNRIILLYTHESGVRKLGQQINAIMRKAALLFVNDPQHAPLRVSAANLSHYLGTPAVLPDELPSTDLVGVVNGLAWTAFGGDLLQVETLLTKGKGELTLTGNLGDVIKESARIAYSYCRNRAPEYGVGDLSGFDVHVHVPEGATPKDGPSAGVTMATSLMSAFTGRHVDRFAAMTGELTLTGRVLPIGGLKEKSLAALRSGIRRIYLPDKNRKDYNELPDRVKKQMEFCFVDRIEEIWRGVLR